MAILLRAKTRVRHPGAPAQRRATEGAAGVERSAAAAPGMARTNIKNRIARAARDRFFFAYFLLAKQKK
ncbi:MAG: hypothetical protein ACJ8NR_02065, partial [Sulfurifustis sp.]